MDGRANNGKSEGSLAALESSRASTQFGAERGNPRSQQLVDSVKPWSVRNSLRRFAKLDVSLDDPASFTRALPKKMSMAEYIAAQGLIRASKLARDFEIVLEQIDGKMATTNISADITAILGMSDDELLKLANEPLTITDAIYSESGMGTQTAGEGNAAGENAGADTAAVSASV